MPDRTAQIAVFLSVTHLVGLGSVTAAHADEHVARAVMGEIIVAPTPGRALAARARLTEHGLAVLETDAVSGAMLVRVPVGQEVLWTTRLGVERDRFVYAERNGIGRGGVVPDDTFFGSQWHLGNTGQTGGTPGADIDAIAAWDLETGSPAVGIAVLDTGIDSDHPEFAGRIDPGGFDFVNEDDDPEADHPHGTWVTGCLAANANNSFGGAGVDWACRVIPIKVLNSSNSGSTFDLAQGINYVAMQPDIKIVSMSLINYPGSTTLITALENAARAGKILVACAGNGGEGNADASWPGASPRTISIGATDADDARAWFSGTGQALDFVAPGEDIVTNAHDTEKDWFDIVSGCSFATPISAGVMGLVLARARDLGMTVDQDVMYELLRAGAEDQVGPPSEDLPGRDLAYGYGRVNALGTLMAFDARFDCNGNGVRDSTDIAKGVELDENGNGVPDSCECIGDIDESGEIGFEDLLVMLLEWGPCPDCPADLDGDDIVAFEDLLLLLLAWGPCDDGGM